LPPTPKVHGRTPGAASLRLLPAPGGDARHQLAVEALLDGGESSLIGRQRAGMQAVQLGSAAVEGQTELTALITYLQGLGVASQGWN
jgi:hypothetical protein